MLDWFYGLSEHLVADIVFAVILLLLGTAFWSRLRERVAQTFVPKQLRDAGLRTGYNRTDDALPRMLTAVAESSVIKILSNRGEDWIGPDQAYLTRQIEDGRRQIAELRILLLHPEAPWLNQWCQSKGRNLRELQQRFNASHASVEGFVRQLNFSAPRYHMEYPIWRMLLTDHKLFLGSYATAGEAREGPVLEFERASVFYGAAARYFDFVWQKSSEWRSYPVPQFEMLNAAAAPDRQDVKG